MRAVWLIAPFLLVAGAAHAGNDDEVLLGNRAALMGGAVASAVRDGSATWYNPAGLGGIARDQLDASATIYSLRLYSAPGYLSSVSGESEDAAVTEFFSAPSHVVYARRMSPKVGLGIGYFAPKSSNLLLRQQLSIDGPEDGSVWQLVLSQQEIEHRFAAAAGIEPFAGLRLGLSLLAGYETGTTAVSVFGAVHQQAAVSRILTSSEVATYARISAELGFGAQLEVTPQLGLAVFGRTPNVLLHRSGTAHYSLADARRLPGDEAELAGDANEVSASRGLALMRAGRLGLGLSYRLSEACFISGELDMQPGLISRRAQVTREEVANARLGIYYQLLGTVGVGAGLFTDRSSDRLEENEISSAGDFYGGTLGVELGKRHSLAASEASASIAFSTVIALRFAHSGAGTRRVVVDPDPTSDEPFSSVPGRMNVNEISLFLGSGVAF